jgi:hypothetical protein
MMKNAPQIPLHSEGVARSDGVADFKGLVPSDMIATFAANKIAL